MEKVINSLSDSGNRPVRIKQQAVMTTKLKLGLPEYEPEEVAWWFKRVDKVFKAEKIEDDVTKIVFLLEKLPTSIAKTYEAQVDEDNYENLKKAILGAKEQTDEDKFQVLQTCELGDRKPSELLAQLFQQLPKDDSAAKDFILKQLFMSKLPKDMARHLDGQPFSVKGHSLAKAQEFANKADSLYAKAPKQQSRPALPINEVSSGGASEPDIEAEVAALVSTYTDKQQAM